MGISEHRLYFVAECIFQCTCLRCAKSDRANNKSEIAANSVARSLISEKDSGMRRPRIVDFVLIGSVLAVVLNNVGTTPDASKCPEDVAIESGLESGSRTRDLALLVRTKRSFGGKEPVNITLVNTNVLGAPGWLPLVCSAVPDVIFHVTGYGVLGNSINKTP